MKASDTCFIEVDMIFGANKIKNTTKDCVSITVWRWYRKENNHFIFEEEKKKKNNENLNTFVYPFFVSCCKQIFFRMHKLLLPATASTPFIKHLLFSIHFFMQFLCSTIFPKIFIKKLILKSKLFYEKRFFHLSFFRFLPRVCPRRDMIPKVTYLSKTL